MKKSYLSPSLGLNRQESPGLSSPVKSVGFSFFETRILLFCRNVHTENIVQTGIKGTNSPVDQQTFYLHWMAFRPSKTSGISFRPLTFSKTLIERTSSDFPPVTISLGPYESRHCRSSRSEVPSSQFFLILAFC